MFSITRKDEPKYWSEGTYDDWLAEMAGARLIIERFVENLNFCRFFNLNANLNHFRFANITDGSVIGVRAPYLRVGKNNQFQVRIKVKINCGPDRRRRK